MRRLRWGVLIVLPLLVLAPPTRGVGPAAASQSAARHPRGAVLSVSTDQPMLRDRPMLATVSPNGDGYRDLVDIRFYVTAAARIDDPGAGAARELPERRAARHGPCGVRAGAAGRPSVAPRADARADDLRDARHALVGEQLPAVRACSHVTRRTRRARSCASSRSDAMLDKPSYAPGETAQLTISNDATALTVHVVDVAGSEAQPTVNRIEAPDLVAAAPRPVGSASRRRRRRSRCRSATGSRASTSSPS